jgi:hypothetical protein
MVKGGPRARSGPPPDPDSLTQVDGEWTVLPASGREGAAPLWPLTDAVERELALWAGEWSRPQAVMWERQAQELQVAMYVRTLIRAEKHDAPTNVRTLLRQQEEALGLSMPGLLRNRWKIGEVEAPADPVEDDGEDPRARLTMVAGGVA